MARTVLIVDDLKFARKTLNQILTDAHFKVVGEAENGKLAVAYFRKLKPDIVIMDIVMPEMSGIEATREILRENPYAKIIVLSAMTQENLVSDAITAGAKDYLIKPYTAKEVIRSVEHVLSTDTQLMDRINAKSTG